MVWLVGFVFHEMDKARKGKEGKQGGRERKEEKRKRDGGREGGRGELEQSEALGQSLFFNCNFQVLSDRWVLIYSFTVFPDLKKEHFCLTEKDIY